MKKNSAVTLTKGLLYSLLGLFLVGGISNCGGGSSSVSAEVQAPKILIQDFIAKQDIMVDKSLVDFYVADEQPAVAAAVERAIEEKTATGELEMLQKASFDFSNMKIAVAGEKKAYVHDEPTRVIKISVSGTYSMTNENNTATIPADKTIILEMVNNQWKVTEKVNPWKEYKYGSRG